MMKIRSFAAALSARSFLSRSMLIGLVFVQGEMRALEPREQNAIALFSRAAPAVVILEIEMRSEELRPEEITDDFTAPPRLGSAPGSAAPLRTVRSEGSGFIVRADGVVLTNYHVIARAQSVTVRLMDNRRFPAEIVGSDERSDIAVVRMKSKDLPVLDFTDSDAARIGQSVYAIGVPFGQEWSFSAGILSGKNRSRLLGPSSDMPLFEDYLQTDAFINAGHSGGPLLDSDGRVLGMNTLIARVERGLAFAIPSNFLKSTLEQILSDRKVSRPWIGVRVETLGESAGLQQRLAGAEGGAVVLSIEPEGPAFKSELRPADVVQFVDGVRIGSSAEMQKELFSKKLGVPITLGIWRMGATKKILISPQQFPAREEEGVHHTQKAASGDAAADRLGMVLKTAKSKGVRVESVDANSPAERCQIVAGDLITDIESKPVHSVADCVSAINSSVGRNPSVGVLLQIERQGRRMFVLLYGD
jgi:serine protease Do